MSPASLTNVVSVSLASIDISLRYRRGWFPSPSDGVLQLVAGERLLQYREDSGPLEQVHATALGPCGALWRGSPATTNQADRSIRSARDFQLELAGNYGRDEPRALLAGVFDDAPLEALCRVLFTPVAEWQSNNVLELPEPLADCESFSLQTAHLAKDGRSYRQDLGLWPSM